MVVFGERLEGARIGCPRCEAPGRAVLWRRFDYFGARRPIYFTKCSRCRRRRVITSEEAAVTLDSVGLSGASKDLLAVVAPPAPDDPVAAARTVVSNRAKAYGSNGRPTIAARVDLLRALGKGDDAGGARDEARSLLADARQALGPDHPSTLVIEYELASWTARSGETSGALTLFSELRDRQERVLGPDHPYTLLTRARIARLVDLLGDRPRAESLLRQVLTDQERVLGSGHVSTAASRTLLEEWVGQAER